MASGYWLLASGSFNRGEGLAFPISCQRPIAETSKQTLKTMRNFKNYEIWIDSIELSDVIYDICESFPQKELYQLASQMERAVVSIPSNIAEGAGRRSEAEFAHFLDIALGSAYELETQLIIAKRRKYISKELFETTDETIMSLQKRIGSFIATVIGEK